MARGALTPQESAAWLHKVAKHLEGWATWPVQPDDFDDSYRSQFVAMIISLSETLGEHFPTGPMTLADWERVDKRMREILTAAAKFGEVADG